MGRLTWVQLAVLAVGGTAAACYVILPYSAASELVFYDGPVALALGASLLGLRGVRATRPRPWALTSIALAGFLVGELVWWSYQARGIDPFPSIADVVFLAAYLPLGLGAASMARAREAVDRDRFVWLDAGILTLVVGVLVWATLMAPYVTDPTEGWWSKGTSIAYPIADIFVLGFLLRLVLARRARTRSGTLFVIGTVLMLAADLWFGWQQLGPGYQAGSLVDLVWILSYLTLAMAALDPSAGTPPPAAPDMGLGRGRLAVVLTAVVGPQLVLLLALDDLGALGATTATIAAAGGTAVSGLVGFRLWSLLGRVRSLESRRGSDRLAAITDHSSDAILLLGADGSIGYATPAVTALWGWDAGACRGTALVGWMVEDDRPGVTRLLSDLGTAEPGTVVEVRGRLATARGEIRLVEGTLRNLLADDAVHAVVATIRDVTERMALESQLRRQAFHDDLTGLANRALFSDRLTHALDRARRTDGLGVAVLFVDLDDFKAVNDGLGHGAGDELLRHVAERIRICVRPGDTVARLGGDEFAILLEDLPALEEATTVAHRILEMLALPVRVLDNDIAVPASIGVAPRAIGCTVESLLRDADIAMYSAKASGKGRVEVFDDALRLAAQQRLQLKIELPAALAAGQVRLVYQPIHELRGHVLMGFEALVRWEHPEHGTIPPVDFIPAAEESGFIVELGRWILHQACAQAAEWNRRGGGGLTMNVNVSGVQLHQPDFADTVAEALRATGLAPEVLTLELTESVLIDHDRIREMLHEIRELGVGIAIDDFGTGYSSLAYLQQLPISAVKIDRSFVGRLVEHGDASLIQSILGMAAALNLRTVAEGVETREQLDTLDALECSLAQGYYLGRPQSVEALDALVDADAGAATDVLVDADGTTALGPGIPPGPGDAGSTS